MFINSKNFQGLQENGFFINLQQAYMATQQLLIGSLNHFILQFLGIEKRTKTRNWMLNLVSISSHLPAPLSQSTPVLLSVSLTIWDS